MLFLAARLNFALSLRSVLSRSRTDYRATAPVLSVPRGVPFSIAPLTDPFALFFEPSPPNLANVQAVVVYARCGCNYAQPLSARQGRNAASSRVIIYTPRAAVPSASVVLGIVYGIFFLLRFSSFFFCLRVCRLPLLGRLNQRRLIFGSSLGGPCAGREKREVRFE